MARSHIKNLFFFRLFRVFRGRLLRRIFCRSWSNASSRRQLRSRRLIQRTTLSHAAAVFSSLLTALLQIGTLSNARLVLKFICSTARNSLFAACWPLTAKAILHCCKSMFQRLAIPLPIVRPCRRKVNRSSLSAIRTASKAGFERHCFGS